MVLILGFWFFSKFGESGKGSFKVTKEGVELTIDEPIIKQVDSSEHTFKSGNDQINFTTGTIDRKVISKIEEKQGAELPSNKFVGSNLIDKQGGFVLASERSAQWSVQHNDEGYVNGASPIVQLTSGIGETVSVNRVPLSQFDQCTSIRCAVEQVVAALMAQGYITDHPHIEFDEPSNTAFLTFTNLNTGGQSYIKAIVDGQYFYIAQADYNAVISDEQVKNDAVKMIASFSVIK